MDYMQIIIFIVVIALMNILAYKRKKEKKQAMSSEHMQPEEEPIKANLKHFLKSFEVNRHDEEEDENEDEDSYSSSGSIKHLTSSMHKPHYVQTPTHRPSQPLKQDENYRIKESTEISAPTTYIEQRKIQIASDKKERAYLAGKGGDTNRQSTREGYNTYILSNPSRGQKLLSNLSSKQDMIVYQELMNPPVSLRPPK